MTIKELRKRKDLSVDLISDKLGIPSSTYYKYEQGKIQMSTATLKQLAEVLEVDFKELLDNYTDNSKVEKPSMANSLQAQYDMAMKLIKDEINMLHQELQTKNELLMSQAKTINSLAEALGKLGGKPLKPHQIARFIALKRDESFTQVA